MFDQIILHCAYITLLFVKTNQIHLLGNTCLFILYSMYILDY